MIRKQKKSSEIEQLNYDRSQLLLLNDDFYIREAYKSLRTNVMFSLTADSNSHVIMVTSALPSEGKSTTSVNLAISFAEAGKRTLLIDCDMRKPKIARLLRIKHADGLSDLLFNSEKIENCIFRINNTELYILSAGSIPPNPSELLGSDRMQRLIDSMREKFEYIILDMPPVNVVTDAVVASPLTDGALIVARAGMSERNAVLHAMDQLQRANAKILGGVLTRINEGNNSYSYSKEYGYGYGYGKTPETTGATGK